MSELFADKLLLMKKASSEPDTDTTLTSEADSGSGEAANTTTVTVTVSTTTVNSANAKEETVVNSLDTVDAKEALKNKVVCLFFSAAWCAPCHHFVPLLREVYTELVRRGDPIEVVFISFDKSSEEMMEYYKNLHGSWLALPFGDSFRDTLSERYSVNMVPKLIVIQPDGEVITMKGRKDIQDKGVVCMRGWHAALNLSTEDVDEAGEAVPEEAQAVS